MTQETAVSSAREIADQVVAPTGSRNDKAGRFPTEAVDALPRAGLLQSRSCSLRAASAQPRVRRPLASLGVNAISMDRRTRVANLVA